MTRRTHFRVPGLGRYVPPMGSQFVDVEVAGGLVLLFATVTALVLANSGWSNQVADFWARDVTIGIGSFSITESIGHWVSDGLMCVFFFVVGLEIKRELVVGELRDPRAAGLPIIAAIGGMVVPALLFVVVNINGAAHGWGVAIATDTAFALGIVAVLGAAVPSPLKIFLLTLAIVDDMLAIVVIALVYTETLHPKWLLGALACIVLMLAMRRAGATRPIGYLLPAVALWVCVLESGVHPTAAAVVLGLMTPARPIGGRAVLEQLEFRLHPAASFLVVPLFALANAGVALDSTALRDAFHSPITWGVIVGLVVGKTVGITSASALALRFGAARLPSGVALMDLLGVATLAGIGFTVAIFVADASHTGAELAQAKIGVIAASLMAAGLGSTVAIGRARRRIRITDETRGAARYTNGHGNEP